MSDGTRVCMGHHQPPSHVCLILSSSVPNEQAAFDARDGIRGKCLKQYEDLLLKRDGLTHLKAQFKSLANELEPLASGNSTHAPPVTTCAALVPWVVVVAPDATLLIFRLGRAVLGAAQDVP